MKLIARTLLSLSLAALLAQAATAQQTLTFTNTDTSTAPGAQNQSVTLIAGSAVSIQPDGNVTAQCTLTGTLCTGTGGGSPVGAPTVTLAPSGFSNPADGQGRYPANTSFTLTPTVTNGEVCIRSVSPTTPAGTSWPATLTGTYAAQVLALSTVSSTYQFTMRCFNGSGATSATYEVSTNAEGGGPGPGPGCTGFQSNLPAAWQRSTLTQTNQVGQVEVPSQTWQPFPNSGGTGYVITGPNQYHSIAFNTPAQPWTVQTQEFFWQDAQQQGAALLDRVYVTISTCPGDFRIPVIDSTATTADPTNAAGCRSFRRVLPGFPRGQREIINYQIGTADSVATETACFLAPGRTYYINFIRADPKDGVIGEPADEQVCSVPGATSCGVQMRYF